MQEYLIRQVAFLSKFGARAACLAAGLTVATMTDAATPTVQAPRDLQQVNLHQLVVTNEQVANLIAGLMGIERDLLLGQLFLQEGMVSAEGSHFAHPRRDNFPVIKDGLAAAGAPDLEPALIALENAKTREEVNAAYLAALGEVEKAKQALQPSDQDLLSAVIATTSAGAEMLDPSGSTDIVSYQECWGLLMIARDQLDMLVLSEDAMVKQAAIKMVLAFDDVILGLPDPASNGSVAIDPMPVEALIESMRSNLSDL
ncbi:hypothetical protein [Frigidibacter sp. SD6-1]|uniref:hypothetical protein n=1 Tax=Frigidibacter sp. SD6-1 TaxID=3032581 RepID=UPI0024E01064|nr:hypothetical protein [Frigidibacter sp. SD6-1]